MTDIAQNNVSTDVTGTIDMTLADMLNSMIESTINADMKAAEDYLELLRDYALDDDNTLQMVDFEMAGSDGRRKVVSIPKLSLLPIPALRVAEATFDIDAQMEIKTISEKEQADFNNRFQKLLRRNRIATANGSTTASLKEIASDTAAAKVRVRFLKPSQSQTQAEKTQTEKMTNVKIHIKLEPVSLADGMRSLLQATESNITVTNDKPANQ